MKTLLIAAILFSGCVATKEKNVYMRPGYLDSSKNFVPTGAWRPYEDHKCKDTLYKYAVWNKLPTAKM